jgi:hypothetical protein
MKLLSYRSWALSAAALGVCAFAAANHGFRPGEVWFDEAGQPINAHGGGFLYDRGAWYWFGESRTAHGNNGVSCYSSRNLYDWKNEGVVLSLSEDPSSPIARGSIIERPKVIYNRLTGKYVMWFHNELRGHGYSAAQAGVAVSDRVTGPYSFVQSSRPDGEMSRDMTLFVDDDGEAYLFTASENNQTMHVHLLSSDYTTTSGKWARIFAGRSMEAPAVFKHSGKYYFVGSDCTGWKPNPQRSAVAGSVWGPWRELGNPAQGPEAATTYGSQTAYVLPVEGKPGAFVWVGDRWHPDNLTDSRYVFLPVQFTGERFLIPWIDAWDLGYFDHAH